MTFLEYKRTFSAHLGSRRVPEVIRVLSEFVDSMCALDPACDFMNNYENLLYTKVKHAMLSSVSRTRKGGMTSATTFNKMKTTA